MKKIVFKQKKTFWVIGAIVLTFLLSCKKFLDEKPNITIASPSTLRDLQLLLDNPNVTSSGPGGFMELIADNLYLTKSSWELGASAGNRLGSLAQNYVWVGNAVPFDYAWEYPYQRPVYYANIVLEQLDIIKGNTSEATLHNALKGSALFYRAFAFQQLAQIFCKPYATENLNADGIVLKLSSNINEKMTRNTVTKTYEQIITDLEEASRLLPSVTQFPHRPSKLAAYGALARTYLSMRDYVNAEKYADLVLKDYSALMNYNTLIPVKSPVVETYNPEVIFHNTAFSDVLLFVTAPAFQKVDSILYRSYNDDDLRKTVFFLPNTGGNTGTYSFRGSYHGNLMATSIFDGLATDEIYLIKAECLARAGKPQESMDKLNALMVTRWKNSVPYPTITASSPADALNKVLTERRKELLFRGLRWSDIRRLNLEGANITLKRVIGDVTYTLAPNDLRSVMLIPYEQINRSGIPQNPR